MKRKLKHTADGFFDDTRYLEGYLVEVGRNLKKKLDGYAMQQGKEAKCEVFEIIEVEWLEFVESFTYDSPIDTLVQTTGGAEVGNQTNRDNENIENDRDKSSLPWGTKHEHEFLEYLQINYK